MLFEPAEINGMKIKNRIVRSATYENMAAGDGKVTDSLLKLYTRLAQGGAGLIISGHAFVHRNGRAGQGQIGIDDDTCIPGLQRLVDAVHEHEARIALQLAHAGRQTAPAVIGGKTPMAPSVLDTDSADGIPPREMTDEDIATTIEAFADAAARAREAGFDAVQLHAAHGYLLSQFLSPHTNRRTDEWGGSLERNLRFVTEVYNKTREAVGDDFPILIKLNVEEGLPDGITVDMAVETAKNLAVLGINAIEISGGVIMENPFMMSHGEIPIDMLTADKELSVKAQMEDRLYSSKGSVEWEEAYWLSCAEKIKPVIGNTPLILVGGMKYPQTMEHILQDGKADFISMSRPLIKEPNFPNEMAEGRKSPAKCSFCNRCLMMVQSGRLACYN